MKPRNQRPEMLERLNELTKAITKNPNIADSYICNEFTNAFCAGIMSGEGWDEKAEIEYTVGVIKNEHFQKLMEALIHSKKCPQDITIKIKDSLLDDTAMSLLAKTITNPNCPRQLNITIQNSPKITATGANILLTALQNPECRLGVKIEVLQPHAHASEIATQVKENNAYYLELAQPEKNKPAKPEKKLFSGLFRRNRRNNNVGTKGGDYTELRDIPKKNK